MSLEYKNRGILHKLNKVGTSHKNFILKTAVKTVLAAETTALFTKDIITNRFVGKEFHVKLERYQSKSGKFKTHVKLIRVKKTKDSPKGMLHKILSLDKKVEGDKPHSKKRFKLVRAALLTSESATIAAGSIGIEELRRKLENSSSVNDGGKATISVLTAAADLNKARKYIVSYKTNRRIYKNLVKHYKQGKKSYKESKKKYKQPYRKIETAKLHPTIYNNLTSFKKFKYQIWGTVNDIGAKNRYKKEKVTVLQAKKKGYKVMRKAVKEHKRETGYVSLGMLPTLPAKYISKKLIESYSQKIVSEASDNDFIQAIDKGYRISKAVKEFDKKVVKPVNEKLKEKYFEHKSSALHLKENRLREKELKPKRKKKINSSQKKLSEKSKEAAKKAAKATSKVVADFAKFAFKFFGITLIPILAIIIVLSVTMLLFSGASGNTGGYVLGTYNCQDKDISYAVEHYTKIAYDFNEKLLRCGGTDWKNALNDLGVDTSEFTEDPNNFYFGRSRYFNSTPSYDFDPDKLAAFMCAYYYWRDDDGHIQNWAWDDSYDEVLQQLFDTEYEFKSYYENRSYWNRLNNYTFYAGGGSGESYWTVYQEDFSKNRMKIRYVPEEIKAFCKDGYLHYDYNTLEVLDANNDDKKTGYFIQDQRYIVQDPSGVVNYPFYSTKDVEYSEVNRFYREGRVYYNSYGTRGAVVDVNNHETNYWIHDINSHPLQYYKFVWKNGVDGRGIPIFEDRTGYYWTSDYKQIYCVVNPTDTHKWNDELEDICLVNFYKKNEWVTVCNLYYTVEKKCSFENAIKKVLQSKYSGEEYESRLEFYNLLTKENSAGIKTYGNHQLFRSPINKYMQDLIDDGYVYHGYGYDIQEWNTKHCEGLNNNHTGMDILALEGTNVYSMIDGYVNWINDDTQSISIMSSENISFWYGEDYPVEVIYTNITTELSQGDEVSEGDYIGKVADYKHCFDNWDIQASKNYLHIELKISYPPKHFLESDNIVSVEPRFLIKREEE